MSQRRQPRKTPPAEPAPSRPKRGRSNENLLTGDGKSTPATQISTPLSANTRKKRASPQTQPPTPPKETAPRASTSSSKRRKISETSRQNILSGQQDEALLESQVVFAPGTQVDDDIRVALRRGNSGQICQQEDVNFMDEDLLPQAMRSQKTQSYQSVDIFEKDSQAIVIEDDGDDDVRALPDYDVLIKEEPQETLARADSGLAPLELAGGGTSLGDDADVDLRTQIRSASYDFAPIKPDPSAPVPAASASRFTFEDEDLLDFVGDLPENDQALVPPVALPHHTSDDDDLIMLEEDDTQVLARTQKESLPIESSQPQVEGEDEYLSEAHQLLNEIHKEKRTIKSPDEMMSDYDALDSECKAKADQIKETYKSIDGVFSKMPAQGKQLKDLWAGRWARTLDTEMARLQNPMEQVIISVIGDSGAGKSSLLNSVLGEFILPTHSSAGCTAAVTELCYNPGEYEVVVEFMARDEFNARRSAFIRAVQKDQDSAARDFVRAVWGDVTVPRKGRYDPPAPKEIESLLGQMQKFTFTNIDDVRKCVSKYVDSTDTGSAPLAGLSLSSLRSSSTYSKPLTRSTTATTSSSSSTNQVPPKRVHSPKIWPIVKLLTIKGPWKILSGGVKLVDLPGANDLNKAREDAAHDFLKASKHLWIVSNIKRAATSGTVANYLGINKRKKAEALMSGLLNSSCIIATHSDDINEAEVRRNLGLEEMEISKLDLARLRNRHSKALIRQNFLSQTVEDIEKAFKEADDNDEDDVAPSQLSDTPNLARAGSSQTDLTRSEQLERLQNALAATPVFTVSSLEYARMNRLEATSSAPMLFQDALDTEIPLLQNFIVEIGHDARKVCLENSTTQARQVLEEIKAQCESMNGGGADSSRDKLTEIMDSKWPFFLKHVKSQITGPILEQLISLRSLYIDRRLDEVSKQIIGSMDATVLSWRQKNFQSFKSALRHGGKWNNKSGVEMDLCEELISQTLREKLASGWNDYFGSKVAEILQYHAISFKNAADHFHSSVKTALNKLGVSNFDDRIGSFKLVNRSELAMHINKARELVQRITTEHRDLAFNLRDAVASHMELQFKGMGEMKGTGAFDKIISTLRNYVKANGADIFAKIKQHMISRLDEIQRLIKHCLDESVDASMQTLHLNYNNLYKIQIARDTLKRPRQELLRIIAEEERKYPTNQLSRVDQSRMSE